MVRDRKRDDSRYKNKVGEYKSTIPQLSRDIPYITRLVGVDLRKYALLHALTIDLTRRIKFITR